MKYHEIKTSAKDYLPNTTEGHTVVVCDNLHRFNIGHVVILRPKSVFYSTDFDYINNDYTENSMVLCHPNDEKAMIIIDIDLYYLPTKVALKLREMTIDECNKWEKVNNLFKVSKNNPV